MSEAAQVPVEVGPGSILCDKWRLDAVLSKDASGACTVYSATHRNTRRFVVKMLSEGASREASTVERFLGRAYAPNTLRHPGVVLAMDDDRTADGRVFVVRDMVDGETLADVVAREGKGLRPTHVVALVEQLLAVLTEAHAAGIVHGRLSLDHVLIGRDEGLRLIGFRAASEPALERVDDVFLVGTLAYRLLTGEPLRSDAPNEPVRAALPGIHAAIAHVFDRALDLDRSNRWSDARSMRTALSEARDDALRVKTGPGLAAPPSIASATRPLATTGSSDLFSSVDVRRMMPIAVIVAIGSPPEGVFKSVITSAVAPEGIRANFVGGSAALLVPPAMTLAHEEAATMARAALKLRDMGAPVKTTLILGQDLLTESGSTERAVARALERTAARAATHVEVDPSLAFLLEQRFVLTRTADALTLDAAHGDDASSRVLGRIVGCFGRATEIDSIGSLIARAKRDASARALVVVGAEGVGKTRLMAEVVARVRRTTPDAEVWTARATRIGRTTALGVLRELVRRACGVPRAARDREAATAIGKRVAQEVWDRGAARRITAELARLSGGALSDETSDHPAPRLTDPGAEGDRELCAFQDFFAAVLARRPLLVVIEDVHHADLASLHALDRTLEHLHDHPWALVATARPEIDAINPQLWTSSGAVRANLAPLDGASRLALAHAAVGADRAADAADIARASGGNPRFVEECARLFAERRDHRAPSSSAGAFASAHEVVRARLALLEPDARLVLALASAFGESFWFRGLAHLVQQRLPAWKLGSYLEAFARAELVRPEPDARFSGEAEFTFADQVVEAEAYGLLSTSEREVTHHLAGQWLERAGERDSAVLAGHFARSESQVEAASWHERSAAEALEKNDIAASLTLAERGLSYVDSGELALSLHLTMQECYTWRAEAGRALPHAKRVYREARPGTKLWCRAVAGLALALPKIGPPEACEDLAKTLADFDSPVEHPRALAGALGSLATHFLRLGQADMVRGLSERLAALERPGDPVVVAHALELRSWVSMFKGDFGQCLRFDRESMRLFTESGDLRNACRCTTSIGYDLMTLGSYELSEKAFRAALATAMRLGIPRAELTSRQHLTLVLLRLERPREAMEFGSQALSIALRGGDAIIAGSTRIYLALALALQHDLESASAQLAEAARELRVAPACQALANAELARIRLREGRAAEAFELAASAMENLGTTGTAEEGDPIIRLAYVEALFATQQRAAALAALASAWRKVTERAALITDPEMRRSFLERIPEHVRTAELAAREGLTG
ncbi:MAG: AAA family ATPase [Polyangiaceae bacterium]